MVLTPSRMSARSARMPRQLVDGVAGFYVEDSGTVVAATIDPTTFPHSHPIVPPGGHQRPGDHFSQDELQWEGRRDRALPEPDPGSSKGYVAHRAQAGWGGYLDGGRVSGAVRRDKTGQTDMQTERADR